MGFRQGGKLFIYIFVVFLLLLFLFSGIEPRVSNVLGKQPTTKLYPWPLFHFLKQ